MKNFQSTLIRLFESIPSTYKINNPLSALPPRYVDQSETHRKFSLSALDKWRHANDKSATDSHKRSSQEYSDRPAFKRKSSLNFYLTVVNLYPLIRFFCSV